MEEARLRPPAWVAGDVALLDPAAPRVAIIGTREASASCLDLVSALAAELARLGATIVSGAADGTDMAAHLAALRAAGATIAVTVAGMEALPLGMDRPALTEAAAAHGGRLLAVSPFPPDQRPTRATPVLRNRLIASLAEAIVVGEAGAKSGTMHCVQAGLEMHRPILLLEAPDAPPELAALHRALAQRGARLLSAAAWRDGRAATLALLLARGHRAAMQAAAEAQLDLL
jgi:DNA processing protein